MGTQKNHNIVAIHITDRAKEVNAVQTVLSKYGDIIKTRLGLHDACGGEDSPTGIIILEVLDTDKKELLTEDLTDVAGVEVKEIVFEH